MAAEYVLHRILVKSEAGVLEAKRRLLANGIMETQVEISKGFYPHVIKWYAPANFEMDFLRPDILPPKDYSG